MSNFLRFSVNISISEKILLSVSVHKAEVGFSSTAIEKHGLERGLEELIAQGLHVSGVIIDQNSSTTKMIADKFPEIPVFHDFYHVVNSVNDFFIYIF